MVVMGRVIAPFGVNGWIKVQPFTDKLQNLSAYPEWWMGHDPEFLVKRVVESAIHGQTILARLENVESRDEAARLKGEEIAVPRSLLPDTGAGEYYLNDLVGCEVVNVSGDPLGSVTKVLETGANSVLILNGKSERLLPFVHGVVLNVDLKAGRISVDWGVDF